jgi:hypothetical protein
MNTLQINVLQVAIDLIRLSVATSDRARRDELLNAALENINGVIAFDAVKELDELELRRLAVQQTRGD